ncbi:MAG: hypothetical protein ABI305_04140 [Tepidiformaceae bacterium]
MHPPRWSLRRTSVAAVALCGLALPALVACSARTDTTASPRDGAATAPVVQVQRLDGRKAILAAANQLQTAPLKAVYDATGNGAMGSFTGTLTLEHKDPKSLIRLDGAMAGSQAVAAIIDDGTATYVCTDLLGEACMKTDANGGLGKVFSGALDQMKPEDILRQLAQDTKSTVTNAPAQTIAGHQGDCFDVSGQQSGTATVCVDSSTGVLLSVKATSTGAASGTVSLVAREISEAPADSDFAPPYPIRNLTGP